MLKCVVQLGMPDKAPSKIFTDMNILRKGLHIINKFT